MLVSELKMIISKDIEVNARLLRPIALVNVTKQSS
jgi:hypothetical protein